MTISIDNATRLHFETSTFSSDDLWNSFRIERRVYSAGHIENRAAGIDLLVNMGEPVAVEHCGKAAGRMFDTNGVYVLDCRTSMHTLRFIETSDILSIHFNAQSITGLMLEEMPPIREMFIESDPYLAGVGREFYEKVMELSSIQNKATVETAYPESLCLTILLHLLSRYAGLETGIASRGKLSSAHLKSVIDYVREGVNRMMTLNELAGVVHLSSYHFSRLFKHTVGVSPYRYILLMKIEKAMTLMTRRKGSILDVAHLLNFADQAHFCNTFRRLKGTSPGRYLQVSENPDAATSSL